MLFIKDYAGLYGIKMEKTQTRERGSWRQVEIRRIQKDAKDHSIVREYRRKF